MANRTRWDSHLYDAVREVLESGAAPDFDSPCLKAYALAHFGEETALSLSKKDDSSRKRRTRFKKLLEGLVLGNKNISSFNVISQP